MSEFVIRDVSITLIIASTIIFLGKKFVEKFFESRFEQLKIEHQIKFLKIYTEGVEVLKNLYKELYDLEIALSDLVSPFKDFDWKTNYKEDNKARHHLFICRTTLEQNRIFLNDDLCSEIEKTLDSCQDVIDNMLRAKARKHVEESRKTLANIKDGEWSIDIWLAQEKRVKNEIKENRIKLAENFRKILDYKITK